MTVKTPEGRDIPATGELVDGGLTVGVIRSSFAIVEGYVREKAAAAPRVFAFSADFGSIAASIAPQSADEGAKGQHRFSIKIPLSGVPEPTIALAKLNVYHLVDGFARAIQSASSGYYLKIGAVTPRVVETRIVHRGTRIADSETLLFYARDGLERVIDDPIAAGGCLCTIGYRELELKNFNDESTSIRRGRAVSSTFNALEGRQQYRWYVSVNLMLSYFHIIRSEYQKAADYLAKIDEAAKHLAHTPQMLTNTLKACLLSGLIQIKLAPGQKGAGANVWKRARSYYSIAVQKWEFENHYSYIELALASLILRQCHAGECLDSDLSGPQIESQIMAPKGLNVSIAPLGFPAVEYKFKDLLNSERVPVVAS